MLRRRFKDDEIFAHNRLFAFSLAVSAPAQAEITLTRVAYAAGVLVVNGETSRPNQRVTLDGRYRTRTDRFGEFSFRIRYLPRDCSISLRAGREARPAWVANCVIARNTRPPRP